jgi:DNA invertase Pin-like site-specific DNA recombinase
MLSNHVRIEEYSDGVPMAKQQQRRVGVYVRVSTSDQTTENQKQELQAWAERAGHAVVRVFEDHGISGPRAETSVRSSMRC